MNLLISLWSISLLQFSVTIQNAETIAQDMANEEFKHEKEKDNNVNDESAISKIEITTERRSNRIAPALYTYKLAQRKALEKQRERRNTMDLDYLKPINQEKAPRSASGNMNKKDKILPRILKALNRFENVVQNFIHSHIDLIQLLTPMLLQDGPFLILRLYLASNYDISESNMFVFLIAKNALVVMLQVYRICVLYCKPSESNDGTDDDIFNETHAVKLRNVQTAHASVRTATLTVQAASRFKNRRKKSRKHSLTIRNPLTTFKKKRHLSVENSREEQERKEDKKNQFEENNLTI